MTALIVVRDGTGLIAVCLDRASADRIAKENAVEEIVTGWADRIERAFVNRQVSVEEVPVGEAFFGIRF